LASWRKRAFSAFRALCFFFSSGGSGFCSKLTLSYVSSYTTWPAELALAEAVEAAVEAEAVEVVAAVDELDPSLASF
jgi:hypothetical protein